MKYFQHLIISILFLIVTNTTDAQKLKVVKDFRQISELGIEKSLSDAWKISFETILKLEKNASLIDEIDFDLNVEYSPYKFISLGTGYRFAANKKSDGYYAPKHRFAGDLQFHQKINRWKLDYRIRYQNIDDDYFQPEINKPPVNILRNKLLVKYNIKRSPLSPYIFTEYYGIMREHTAFPLKIKTGAGVKYSLKKYGQLNLFYRIDRELNADFPYTYFNLGAGYSYEF